MLQLGEREAGVRDRRHERDAAPGQHVVSARCGKEAAGNSVEYVKCDE